MFKCFTNNNIMKNSILVSVFLFVTTHADSSILIVPKEPFKAFLKSKNISMDINNPNKYETIQPDNKYSNYYFGIHTMLPNNWEYDRGASQYALIRALNKTLSSTISIIAIPTENESSSNLVDKFKESPLSTMNMLSNGDVKKELIGQLYKVGNMKVKSMSTSEEFIALTNYFKTEYEYYLVAEGEKTAYINTTYQVIQKGVTYTIAYSCPVKYFNKEYILNTLQNTFYLNIE